MASFELPRQQKDKFVKDLKKRFCNVDMEIIRTIAFQLNYDVQRTNEALLRLCNETDGGEEINFSYNLSAEAMPWFPNNVQEHHEKFITGRQSSTATKRDPERKELDRIISNIQQGFKVLVILRGLPGSGKSHLARQIVEETMGPENAHHHVFSTDDYFITGYRYIFNSLRLPDAHDWNKKRAFNKMSEGVSPIIIDNTNTEIWEMEPYATVGIRYGYMLEILEPKTSWCFRVSELAKRNTHGVPKIKISQMKDRYQKNISAQQLMRTYGLKYNLQKFPQYRDWPLINFATGCEQISGVIREQISKVAQEQTVDLLDTPSPVVNNNPCQWESANFDFLENAWGIDQAAQQTWEFPTPSDEKPETIDKSCNVDYRDYRLLNENYDLPDGVRIIQAHARDITVGTIPKNQVSIPKKIMIDKSSQTDEISDEELVDKDNEIMEIKHMFPHIPISSLQDLYERCGKNAHWTIDLLLSDNSINMMNIEHEHDHVIHNEHDSVTHESSKSSREELNEVSSCSNEIEHGNDVNSMNSYDKELLLCSDACKETVSVETEQDVPCLRSLQPGTSRDFISSDESLNVDDESSSCDDDSDSIIDLNIGLPCVNELETLFGGQAMEFPDGIKPVVKLPKSLAKQLYLYYKESIYHQMEEQKRILLKEDEELAKALQEVENDTDEIVNHSPPELDLKDIMDEQFALNLYQNEVKNKIRNVSADTLAQKLTKQKLFSSFPQIDRNIILEIYNSNDKDYQKTVEDLINSVGIENLNSAVENIKEPPLTKAILDEMKMDEESSQNLKVTEDTDYSLPPQHFRAEANKHSKKGKEYYNKANYYYRNGMTDVSNFYMQHARNETELSEKMNNIAVAAIANCQAKSKQPYILDLHNIYVKEAIQVLDIFIDHHINLLQNSSETKRELTVITGWGKNSPDGKSKLRPVVLNRLKKRGLNCKLKENPGAISFKVVRWSNITSNLDSDVK